MLEVSFAFTLGKGMARTCSLLYLLDLVSRMKTGQHDLFVSLWASACIVFATVETHVDWVSVAIANANISARGAIRQAHDVITWAGKLQKLSARGVNAETVISQFNGQSTQAVALKRCPENVYPSPVAPRVPRRIGSVGRSRWHHRPVAGILGRAQLVQQTHSAGL